MSLEAIGVVDSFKWQAGAKKTFLVVMFKIDGQQYPLNMAYYDKEGGEELITQSGKIQITYVEKQNGQYTNREIKSWKKVEGGAIDTSSQPSAPASSPVVSNSIDERQENINRQSAYHQAVQIVNTLATNGYNLVPGSTTKAKTAQKDPEVLFGYVQWFARRIKEDVQQGDWDAPYPIEDAPDSSKKDDPKLPE